MTFIFGNLDRLLPYRVITSGRALTLWNIFFLKADDIILVTRAWSPVIALIGRFRHRPKVIQFADGLVTESNCTKLTNRYPQPLYSRVYADALYVLQCVQSLPEFIDTRVVRSVVRHKLEKKIVTFKSVVLVFGNDPYVGHSPSVLTAELRLLKDSLHESLPIRFSTTSATLASILLEIFPDGKNIGKFSNYQGELPDPLVITTPSTVGYACGLKGMNVAVFRNCKCQTMNYLFTEANLMIGGDAENGFRTEVFAFTDIENVDFSIPSKRDWSYEPIKFSIVGLHRLFGDLWWLIKATLYDFRWRSS